MKTILLLGGAAIHGPDGTTTGRGPRARMALLAVLATSRGRTASRERLAALLWPDNDTDRARHLVREAIYRLREQLGESALVSVGDEIRLDDMQVDCDVWQLERAARQGEWPEVDRLYRGPFLDSLSIGGSVEFEQLVDAERSRLAALHSQAIESLAANLTARGEWDSALVLWKRRATADPYNSRIALQLMATLDAAGDRGGALRHAALHTELLAAELGAAPDPDVAAFAERLRREPAPRARPSVPNGNGNGAGNGAMPAALTGTSPGNGDPSMAPMGSLVVDGDTSHDDPELAATTHLERAISLLPRRRGAGGLIAIGASVLLTAGFVGMRAFRAEPALDLNRLAILPAQTSGADSALRFLRDGLVWALALHFNSSVGPVAVDPGEALAAWNRSGVGDDINARDARRVARQVGAGQVAYAAVLGTAEQFTIQIRVLAVSDGSTRVGPIEIEGSVDNWQAAMAHAGATLRAHLTDAGIGNLADVSPEVLRLYIEGMDEYRQANWLRAGDRLFRAFEQDSTFIAAGYRFSLIHALTAPIVPMDSAPLRFRLQRGQGGPKQLAALWLYGHLWRQRQGLPGDQRQLLEAVIDSVNILWQQEQLPKLEKAAPLLPNSAEASMLLGGALYRTGRLLAREAWAEQAKIALERSWMLDSVVALKAPAVLADLAFMDRNTLSHAKWSVLADRIAWAWENPTGSGLNVSARGPAYRRYQRAILGGNPTAIRDARTDYSRAWARGQEVGPDWAIRGLSIPAYELDSLLTQMSSDATSDAARHQVDIWASHAAALSGHPRRAIDALRRSALDWTQPDTFAYHINRMAWAEFGFDSAAAEETISIARAQPELFNWFLHAPLCTAALTRMRYGDTAGIAGILAQEPRLDDTLGVISAWRTSFRRGPPATRALCGLVARGVLASLTTGTVAGLHRADTLMRVMPLNSADWWNYDLALAFARRGEYALAAGAVRRQFHDSFPLQRLVLRLRQEGSWAARAGDTTAAINALKEYLVWRSDPDSSLIPQRDSVRAELAALERGTRRPLFRWIAPKR
jgi:DNA-binding SARP family transcriptional activator/tetratricopeptide (TPR) repeat protein